MTDSPETSSEGGNATAGPIGGASGDAGVEYRRAVAAYAVAHALAGHPLAGLGIPLTLSQVASVAIETDEYADDVRIRLVSGHIAQVQAKLTLRRGKPFDSAIAQWSRAAKAGLDPERDRLIIVANSISSPLKVLANLLDRMRTDEPGSLTGAEQTQIAQLKALTPDLTEAQRTLMLRCGVITRLELVEESSSSAETARALLRIVVPPSQTETAWRVLMHQAGRVGRLRGGFAVEGWVRLLTEDGIEVVGGSTPAREAVLTAQAVDRYRDFVHRRGTHVDLRTLGGDVAPIPFDQMDAEVTCSDPEGKARDEESLPWSLLRRKRVLLTGLPGGGKSTALAAAGAVLVRAAGAPLPVVVSLREVANLDSASSLADRILDTAVRELPASERARVRDRLQAGLQTGETALLLDSLDETHSRRGHVVIEVATMCSQIHDQVPVLLATRDVAYAPAHTLGWDDLRLNGPDKPEVAVRSVLEALGATRAEGDPHWVEERVDWVMRVINADKAIGQTPLLPILLALVAADRGDHLLPVSRAEILHTVVQDLVMRRERERDLLKEMTGLSLTAATEAIQASFCLEARVLAEHDGVAPVSTLREALATMLEVQWGLAPGAAGSGATSIVHFWDEAGVFVIDGAGTQVAPRLELYLDIGEAVSAAQSSADEIAAWVQERLASGRLEPIILAAGLNSAAATALVREACSSEEHDVLHAAAGAVRERAEIQVEHIEQLRKALATDARRPDREGWRSFRAILDLPNPEPPSEVEQVLADYPPGLRSVGLAAAGQYAARAGLISLDDLDKLELPLLDTRWERLEARDGSSEGSLDAFLVPRLTDDVVVSAAERLLGRYEDLAPQVAALLDEVSLSASRRLGKALEKAGRGDLVADSSRLNSKAFSRLAAWFRDYDADGPDKLLDHLALSTPAALTPPQASDLGDLADLYVRIDLDSLSSWPQKSDADDWWYEFVDAVIQLGGYDSAVLSAQARLLQDRVATFGHAPFFALGIGARLRPLDRWEDVSDAARAVELLLGGFFKGLGIAHTAAVGLSYAPPELVIEPLAAVEEQVSSHRKHQLWAARALMAVQEGEPLERWASDDAVVHRLVAAECLDAVNDQDELNPLLKTLAVDADREVARAAIRNMASTPDGADVADELQRFLEDLIARDLDDWSCASCATINTATATSCRRCHIVPPDPKGTAQEALARLG